MSDARQKLCCRKAKVMSSTAQEATNQMRDAVLFAAGPRSWDDTRDSWLARGAARLGIPFQRAYALFYRRVTNPSAAEYLEITRRHRTLQERLTESELRNAETRAAIARERDAWAGRDTGAGVEQDRAMVMAAHDARQPDQGGD